MSYWCREVTSRIVSPPDTVSELHDPDRTAPLVPGWVPQVVKDNTGLLWLEYLALSTKRWQRGLFFCFASFASVASGAAPQNEKQNLPRCHRKNKHSLGGLWPPILQVQDAERMGVCSVKPPDSCGQSRGALEAAELPAVPNIEWCFIVITTA